jgi:benzil reductase ((S)-benzoin forming)
MINIITGTSRGIGKALAKFYLQKDQKVVGISRQNEIKHPNFTFVKCDFTEKQQLYNLDLSEFAEPENYPVRLFNNAGILGEIKRTHELTLTHYTDVSMVNIVATQFLCSYTLQTFGLDNVDTIVNISSGAGGRPVPSWAAYCASKAAVNLFTETMAEELKELGKNTKVYSIAPGVVDTDMQHSIRNSDQRDFSNKQNFVDLKENDELRTPEEVAILLDEFLQEDHSDQGVLHRI